jgi:heptosyltransferase-2
MRVLLIQTAFLGDVVLATAVANSLKAAHPQAEVHLLVRRGNEGLLLHHPALHRVWVWDKSRHKLRHLWQLSVQLRALAWDVVVNLHRFATSGWLTWRVPAREKRGFAKNPFSWAYTHRYPHHIGRPGAPWQHETARNHALVADLCGTPTPLRPSLHPAPDDYAAAAPYRLPGRIVVAPASVWATKTWPPDKWAQLLQLLPPDAPVLLVGAPSDKDLCQQLAAHHPRATVLAGSLSLLQTAAVLDGARHLFANDSAPLHLASCMNTPTTAVYCSTVPEFGFGPLADQSTVVQYDAPLPCRPCGLHGKRRCPQGHFTCAQGIAPGRVAGTLCA